MALPKGRLQEQTRALLDRAKLGMDTYAEGSRYYRVSSTRLAGLSGKVFQERDVPVQVSIGNYDIGICGSQWVDELLAAYPLSGIVRVADLGYGRGAVVAATSRGGKYRSTADLKREAAVLRLVSEYPGLAEALALRLRLRRFKVFPVWGAPEAYPPDNCDIVLVWVRAGGGLPGDLEPIETISAGGACLIANRRSWERLAMQEAVGPIFQAAGRDAATPAPKVIPGVEPGGAESCPDSESIWIALPDGHQQSHAARFLERAGVVVEGYSSRQNSRRPEVNLPGVKVKVIRPQDMPMQVANGNFDLAVTGRDWLTDHLCRFPASPVREVLDLGFGRVSLVAAMDGNEAVENLAQLRKWIRARPGCSLRVASEYVNIADRFARDNHLVPYRVIPTWGATEAFIPEDADLLIENTETGRTLAENNLRVVDTLAVSTGCLVANKESLASSVRAERLRGVVRQLEKGLAR